MYTYKQVRTQCTDCIEMRNLVPRGGKKLRFFMDRSDFLKNVTAGE